MWMSTGCPTSSGLIHAGGLLQDALLPSQTLGSVRKVFAPKLAGALNLHCALTACAPAAAAAFSSIAGVLGSPGQGNYAAANSALDAWVEAEHAQVSLWMGTLIQAIDTLYISKVDCTAGVLDMVIGSESCAHSMPNVCAV